MSDAVIFPSPASLAPSAQEVLASISRNELVNLLIVEHVRIVTAQADAEAKLQVQLSEALAAELRRLYEEVYAAVLPQIRSAVAALDAALIPRVAKSVGVVLNCHSVDALLFDIYEVRPVDSNLWHASRHSHADLSPGLHEVVCASVRGRASVPVYNLSTRDLTPGKWTAVVQYASAPSNKQAPRDLYLDVAMPFEMPSTAAYAALWQEYQERASRINALRASVDEKNLPALERKALATLTQAALTGQGVDFDTQKLLAALR
jgi:hypothetical protein